MFSYCFKCIKKEMDYKDKGKLMLLSTCAVCHSKKSRFIKKQEASELSSNLGLKMLLRKKSLY